MAGLYIAHHLSRHDVIVEVRNIVAHGQDVSLRICSHAAQQSADLIVMGGYGHSRLREFVLGGATRDILEIDGCSNADVTLNRPPPATLVAIILSLGVRVRPQFPSFASARDQDVKSDGGVLCPRMIDEQRR